MKNEKNGLFSAICILIVGLLCCGCTSSEILQNKSIPPNDPETGMFNWMVAMNDQNTVRLYELSPEMIKKQIPEKEFLAVNEKNIFFIKNFTFVDYKIYNISRSNNSAKIEAQLIMASPDIATGNISYIPIFYTFNENFENNEWKVWATGFQPI